jgi:hypothetical protein
VSYVESLLSRDERVVRTIRPHWVTLISTFAVDFGLVVVIAGLTAVGVAYFPPYPWFLLLLLLVPAGHLAACLWRWRTTETVVTNCRIIQVTGVFDKHVSDTLLEKINDIVTTQSAWGRLLNFGDVQIIAGSDSGTDVFVRIADPVGLKVDLLDQIRAETPAEGDVSAPDAERSEAEQGIADIPQLIEELADLCERGLLTDEEFQAKKRQLLDRI